MFLGLIFILFNSSFFYLECSGVLDVMSKYVSDGFKTKRLSANLTTREDMDEIWRHFLDKKDMCYYDDFDNWPKNKKEVLEYLVKKQSRDNCFYFSIKLNEGGKPKVIGQLNFKFLRDGVLTLSYWIAKDYRRKGYLKEIGFKFIEEVFFKLKNVNVLEIYFNDMNVASKGYVLSLFRYLKERHDCEIREYTSCTGNEVVEYRYLCKK